MTFIEDNEYNVNMKYKLKQNDSYVAGDFNTWVNASELNIQNLVLQENEQKTYTLEWKWIESTNDTEIGILESAIYQLSIHYCAEEIIN
ncbi:MAG: hypothetical protein FWF46_08015 [Oscillospiraceae bacterium]|nr:hypothetical protein [Oscillospiraceae bacterium]